jgi:hypothetical protein
MTVNHRVLLMLIAVGAVAAATAATAAFSTRASQSGHALVTEAALAAPGSYVSPDRLVALRLEPPSAVPENRDTGGRGTDVVALKFARPTRHVVRIDPADLHQLRARVTNPAGAAVLELDAAHPEGVLHARRGTYRLEVLRNEDGHGTVPVFLRPGSTTISTSCAGCDLQGLDAHGLDLAGVDLRGAQLAGTGISESCAEAYATGDATPGCALPTLPQPVVAQDLVVTAATPLVLDGGGSPVRATFGSVTIEPGGRIEVDSPAVIQVQNLTIVENGELAVEGAEGAAGQAGATGAIGTSNCASRAGLPGGSGGAGGDAPDVMLQADQIEGGLNVVVQGGSGGAGGAGGASGMNVRFAPKCPRTIAAGGAGGAAGAGSTVTIYYGTLGPGSFIFPETGLGAPGTGGPGSPPGSPGAAGTTSHVEIMQLGN